MSERRCLCRPDEPICEQELFQAYGAESRSDDERIRRMLARRSDPPRTRSAIDAWARQKELAR